MQAIGFVASVLHLDKQFRGNNGLTSEWLKIIA